MVTKLEFMMSIPHFWDLAPGELDSVSRLFFKKTAARGEMIRDSENSEIALYFVASGTVKIYTTSTDGKEQILRLLGPGGSFNNIIISYDQPKPANAQALEPSILYGIRKSNLETLILNYPKVGMHIIKTLTNWTQHLISLIEDLSFKQVVGRLARIIIEYTKETTGERLYLTQQEMASMMGCTREVAGRSLKVLEEQKLIKLDRHRIMILDVEGLKQIMDSGTLNNRKEPLEYATVL
jgi:CRP/FNR family cyclic AMP-dependent transcriptional regulator